MTLTDAKLAELLAGCDGVTPGPWTYGAQWLSKRVANTDDPTRDPPQNPAHCPHCGYKTNLVA